MDAAFHSRRKSPPKTATLVILTGVAAMNMHLFVPSLPAMAEHFGTEYRVVQLSVALFLGMNGVLNLIVGPLSDRFGRRPVMLSGIVIYILATFGCLAAEDITTFLVFRSAQAAIVVAMVLSRAVIRDVYDTNRSAAMLGYVTMGMAVVPMIAPFFGGLIDTAFGWRANFWLFVVTGFGVLALAWADLGETNLAPSESLMRQIADYPALLASPRFWGYGLSSAFASGVFFSFLGGAPFVGTEIFGLAPAHLGALFGAPSFGYFLGNFISARTAPRLGINRLILIGALVCTAAIGASLALFLLGMGSAATFFGFMTFVGLANGLVLPNSMAGSLSVRPRLAGTASGLGGALMIGGGAMLSALAGGLLHPDSGPYPLLYIQLALCIAGVVSILLVIRRERRLARQV